MKDYLKITIWSLFYLLVFSFLLYNSFGYLDADLGWHLKVGEQISREKAVPTLDYYDYTLEGKSWVDHEWLLNYLTFQIFNNFGYLALTIFFVCLALGTLLLLTFYAKKFVFKTTNLSKKQTCLVMFFQFFGVMAAAPHLGVRMQEITLFFIVILLIIIHQYSQERNYKILWWLLPLFCLWANAHAGFLIGLFLLFFFVGIKIVEIIAKRIRFLSQVDFYASMELKNIFIFFGISLLAVGSTLITPYGLKLYSFLGDYSNTFYMKLIAEWLPFYCLPIQYKQLLYAAFVAAALLLYTINFFVQLRRQKKIEINLWEIALTFLFLILAFKSKRHFPLFFALSWPFLLRLAHNHLSYPPNFFSFLRKNKILNFYLIAGFILGIAGFLLKTNFTNQPFSARFYCQIFPCEAVNFLKQSQEYKNYRLFNNYDWGGYLIWVYPEKKLFIDGRLPQYPYQTHTLLEEYLDFFKKEETEKKLQAHQIDMVLFRRPKSTKVGWLEKNFLKIQKEDIKDEKSDFINFLDTNWKKIYEDSSSKIYVKN